MNNDTDDEKVFSTSVCVRSGKAGGGRGRFRKKEFAGTNFVFFIFLPQSVHAYENHVDDGPKMCEESSNYDRLRTGSSLLKDEDCTLGNISVSKI